ncbi:helix-turn-helix domain-containing protein [Salinarimonas sp. NSM]|uniref:helix-turn-helix domain-containing protein n=1 Tax=Salinarimonas sp. NSM TaxID=3458003 RepID=UPI004037548B
MCAASPLSSLDPALAAAGDVARFWRVPRYSDLDCLAARFRRHAYARHTHETYAIAAVVEGCETFWRRGTQNYAFAGSLCLVSPDEAHDGEPYGGHFVYRTLYPSPALMREVAEDLLGRPVSRAPWFAPSVVDDPGLVAELAALHDVLATDSGAGTLETDERLLAFLARLVSRHGDLGGAPAAMRESRAVARVREAIDAHFPEDLGLETLAREAGLSRTHLIRAFKRETGLTPHAYQVDRRFRAACRLLVAGEPPATAAIEVGFYDQSHLNRAFKARMGITPGAYAARAAA